METRGTGAVERWAAQWIGVIGPWKSAGWMTPHAGPWAWLKTVLGISIHIGEHLAAIGCAAAIERCLRLAHNELPQDLIHRLVWMLAAPSLLLAVLCVLMIRVVMRWRLVLQRRRPHIRLEPASSRDSRRVRYGLAIVGGLVVATAVVGSIALQRAQRRRARSTGQTPLTDCASLSRSACPSC